MTTISLPWFLYLSLRLKGEETLKCRCVYQPRAEKFIIVSKNHGHTQKCDFCFAPELPFLGKFGLKNQNYQFKLKFGT